MPAVSSRGHPPPSPPSSYAELELIDNCVSLNAPERRDAPSPRPAAHGGGRWEETDGGLAPSPQHLGVLAAVWKFDFLTAPQLSRIFYPGEADRSVRRKLGALFEAGLLRRFTIHLKGGRRAPTCYRITRPGFELLKLRSSEDTLGGSVEGVEWRADDDLDRLLDGRETIASDEWRDSKKRAAIQLIHDLHVGAWVYAFRSYAHPAIRQIHGPKTAWHQPPWKRDRRNGGEKKTLGPADLAESLEGGVSLCDLGFEWGTVRPDAAIEMFYLNRRGNELRTLLAVELERQRHPAERHIRKMQNYDAFITAWYRTKHLWSGSNGRPGRLIHRPQLIFVCPDWESAKLYARKADIAIRGSVIDGQGRANYPARERVFFTAESYAHYAAPRVLMLPKQPPQVRAASSTTKQEADRVVAQGSSGSEVEWPPRNVLDHAVC